MCRRFTFGVRKNAKYRSFRGYGAEVSFKKWAEFQTRGNTRLERLGRVLWKERLIATSAPVLNYFGSVAHRLSGDSRWRHIVSGLAERMTMRGARAANHGHLTPDVFLLEVYNPGTGPVNMQVKFYLNRDQKGFDPSVRPYLDKFVFPRGYSRHEIPYDQLRTIASHPFSIVLTPEAESHPRLIFLTADFVRYSERHPQSGPQKSVKCVVWDLDNTIWDGILSEGDTVEVKPHIPEILRTLDKRGVLLSIVSKNDVERAWPVLEQAGLAELFLYPQINWSPKSENIKQIAKDLNIGIDTLAFIDDNLFELEQVSRVNPTVLCINEKDVETVLQHPAFAGSDSADASQRRLFYKAEVRRRQDQVVSGDDYVDFLRGCEIVLQIDPFDMKHFDRVAELVQRTNQLNFSGRKYSRADLTQFVQDPGTHKFVLNCSDRYGSYGTVGFALVEFQGGTIRLLDFMLSCRVQGKFIEKAFLSYLTGAFETEKPAELWVNFNETNRNKPAAQVLASLAFKPRDGQSGMWLTLTDAGMTCDFIEVRTPAP